MDTLPAAAFLFGCDYAWTHPSVAALKAANVKFVCRYLSNDPTKNITASELSALRSAGILVVFNWEAGAEDMVLGFNEGVAEAKTSQAMVSALGAADAVIYFSADFNALGAQVADCVAYLRGVNSVIGKARTGVYGDYNVTQACMSAGVVSFTWGTPAWDGDPSSWMVNLYQYGSGSIGNVTVDLDAAYGSDFGQWPRPAPPRPPVGPFRHVTLNGQTLNGVALSRGAVPMSLFNRSVKYWKTADKDAIRALKLPKGFPVYTANDGRQTLPGGMTINNFAGSRGANPVNMLDRSIADWTVADKDEILKMAMPAGWIYYTANE
jgi:Domain of unknown function (DUF1906)